MRSMWVMVLTACLSLGLVAGEWKGLDEASWISGRKVKPLDLRRRIVVVVDWGVGCPDCPDLLLFVQKNVAGQRANGHPVDMIASQRRDAGAEQIRAAAAEMGLKCPVYDGAEFSSAPGQAKLPFAYVVDTTGTVIYHGTDKNAAVVALVDALTNLPVPGQLINGVALRKFRTLQKKLVMGVKAEGSALASVKAALKSSKPAEVEEAQAILDSVARAKKNLVDEIADDLAAGDKGAALRDIRWFRTTWPSEAATYDRQFKELSADPEAKAGEASLLKALKKQRR